MPNRMILSRQHLPIAYALSGCFLIHHGVLRALSAGPANTRFAAASQALGGATQTFSFPQITADALDRTTLKLPAQLEGKRNLLLLSWARDQGPQLETWTATAQALQHTDFDFRVYRMLVSAPESTLFRWWDNASLRAAETDPQLLHWEVPLYTDKAALRRSLGIGDDEHQVAAVLVDRDGRVLWHAEGNSTAQGRKSLMDAAHSMR